MRYIPIILIGLCVAACQSPIPEARQLPQEAPIWPDYKDVTIPTNICPLNFTLYDSLPAVAVMRNGAHEIRVDAHDGLFDIPENKWKKFLQETAGHAIQVDVFHQLQDGWVRYRPFELFVCPDDINPTLVYRRIQPGYRMWGEMGIYQRDLKSFKERVILNNSLTNNSCMNCHSFCQQNPGRMLFHQRSTHAGTYIVQEGRIEKVNTKVDGLPSALVYPSWHPSGRYVAFSCNDIKQDYHLQDINRIEVYDQESDVVVYDVEQHTVLLCPLICRKDVFETFPTFSPDGRTLYFCAAGSREMPADYQKVKYNLCALSFDPEKGTFGNRADTLINASRMDKSISFPRVSPDGRYLMYTMSSYGNFSIWHRDADLHVMELSSQKELDMDLVNSTESDSYHSWSSDSRWFVFSSRRGDGLYTRPYLCHMDEAGNISKPFMLPQKNPGIYARSLYSYNIPELVKDAVRTNVRQLVKASRYQPASPVKATACPASEVE